MVVWAIGQEKKKGIIRTQANKKPLLIKSDRDQLSDVPSLPAHQGYIRNK